MFKVSFFSLLFLFSISLTAKAQNDTIGTAGLQPSETTNDGIWHDPVTKEAEFPGGTDALYKYINNHLVRPVDSTGNFIKGKVYVKFTIQKDGSIKDPHIMKGYSCKPCEKEALKVFTNMPNWIPAENNGVKVARWKMIPIFFKEQ